MDVTALYPNVPHEEGLASLRKALDGRVDKSVPTDFLVMLMRMVLTKNTFEWDRKLFIQKDGTAIGTRAAPTYAGIFMGELEVKALLAWLHPYGGDLSMIAFFGGWEQRRSSNLSSSS